MSNMSYCRFQNTLLDLIDCASVLEEEGLDNLSGEERDAALRLLELCRDIASLGDSLTEGESK